MREHRIDGRRILYQILIKEDWSAKGFYRTMLRSWRLSQGPFYLKRPLSADEYQEAADTYIRRASQEHLGRISEARLSQKLKKAKDLRHVRIPRPRIDGDWELEIAIGRLQNAETSRSQSAARRHLRALAARRSPEVRRFLKRLRVSTPQAKRSLSAETLWRIVIARAFFQFRWNFLREEVRATVKGEGPDWTL